MSGSSDILAQHLRAVAAILPVQISPDNRWLHVPRFPLPAGFSASTTNVLIGVPPRYPITPPGILPYGVFLPRELRFRDRALPNLYPRSEPAWRGWAWLCFRPRTWDPCRDSLSRFLEMLRSELSNY